jgi:organic radical activating enzyme
MSLEWLTFHVTDRCQLDCHHCLRDPGKTPVDLPVALIRRVLEEGKASYGSHHAAFSGGEPTLHPQFLELVDTAVELGYTWHMVSNGHRFPVLLAKLQERPARLAGMTSVTFSIDGADAAMHDSIREKGSFHEVLRAASACVATGTKFVLQMAVHARNQHQIELLGLLASQLGAARLSFTLTQPTGTHHDRDHYLSVDEWRRLQGRIEALQQTLTMPVSMPEGWYSEQPFHVCQPFASQQVHVDVVGRVNLCCQHSGIPGDGEERDVAADLHDVSLVEAHRALLRIVHAAQAAKLDAIQAAAIGPWDHFPCNWCMKSFGKPHWTEDGVGGPEASRQRWRGKWAERNRRLPLVPTKPLARVAVGDRVRVVELLDRLALVFDPRVAVVLVNPHDERYRVPLRAKHREPRERAVEARVARGRGGRPKPLDSGDGRVDLRG